MPNPDQYRDAEGRTFSQFVADQVREAIFAQGKTVRGFAREAGINEETFRQRIHNVRPFTTRELAMVATALGIHPAELINAEGFIIDGGEGD